VSEATGRLRALTVEIDRLYAELVDMAYTGTSDADAKVRTTGNDPTSSAALDWSKQELRDGLARIEQAMPAVESVLSAVKRSLEGLARMDAQLHTRGIYRWSEEEAAAAERRARVRARIERRGIVPRRNGDAQV
jgi:hypothetical protein